MKNGKGVRRSYRHMNNTIVREIHKGHSSRGMQRFQSCSNDSEYPKNTIEELYC